MIGGLSDLRGERALLSEVILQAFENYVALREMGYIVDGEPKFIPDTDNMPHNHDEAYVCVRFLFGKGLDWAVSMGRLRIDPDAIRSKLEPDLWLQLHERLRVSPGVKWNPTEPWPGCSPTERVSQSPK